MDFRQRPCRQPHERGSFCGDRLMLLLKPPKRQSKSARDLVMTANVETAASAPRGYLSIKRGIDLAVASLVLIGLSWLIGLLCVAVRVKLGAPVFFRQARPGLGGRPFHLVKFRTMTDGRGRDGRLLPDEQRLTLFGRFLRAMSLDELPTLWNVWKGDMSLVGPRPLLMSYLDRYTPEQARRHSMRPGVTGLAQVTGRNALSWTERFAKDVWYVDHASLRLDLWILWKTLIVVVKRQGITHDKHVTMPEFLGSDLEDRDRRSST